MKPLLDLLRRMGTGKWTKFYQWEEVVNTEIPEDMQDAARNAMTFGFLDRLTTIFKHYTHGPILGFNLHIFQPDKNYREPEKFITVCCITSYVSLMLGFSGNGNTEPLPALVLLLFLFCPQMLYSLSKIQHTIFEYRAYLACAGVASILAYFCNLSIVRFGPWTSLFGLPILILFIRTTRTRNLIYSDTLLFWKQAHLDVQSDSLIASAYIYQLQKRERFGEIDDIYDWMTGHRIPSCRSFLINLAAAKFGSKTDSAPIELDKLRQSVQILEETARQWPKHADVWRNLGTVQYYLSAQGDDNYSMDQPLEYFRRALAINPLDSLTHLSMGHCYAYEGRWEEAVGALTNAYNYLPAGAYIVEEISLVRIKLMEALERAGDTTTDPVKAMEYRREFGRHQAAFEVHHAYYVTEENAKYIV